jgi:hypothetical protein
MKRYVLATLCGLTLLSFSLCSPAKAQGPIPEQAYQIPDGYGNQAAGTTITYGGASYVIQDNGTMLLATGSTDTSSGGDDPGSGQAYQIPDGYGNQAAGTTIAYGGTSYVIQANGTMLQATGSTDMPSAGSGAGSGQLYQIPAGYAGYSAGTPITYGGNNYTIGLNGTMVLVVATYHSNYTQPGNGNHPTTAGGGHPPVNPAYHPGGGGHPPVNPAYHPGGGGHPPVNPAYHPGGGGHPPVNPAYHPGGGGHPSANTGHPAGGGGHPSANTGHPAGGGRRR